jgi:signal transduction histidine kinase
LSERVLYMEDDASQTRLVRKCLERVGYEVDVACDGAEGLARCAERNYDAVIVDQTMPVVSGLDVIRAMLAQKPLPPTIMVTGTGNERIAVEAMKLGVSDYLVKDLEGGFVNVLPLVVRRSIEQHRTLLEKQRIEKELAQAQKMRAIGQLASGIAHEINTPNQYIADNAHFLQDAFADISDLLNAYERLLQAAQQDAVSDELIEEVEAKLKKTDLGYLKAEIPQAIQQSIEGVEHVAGIVGAMKEFSHPGTGCMQPTDLNHIIEGAVTLCCNEWKYVANVETDFDPDLPQVYCLASDINRVVINLVINAAHAVAKAMYQDKKGKGQITVRTRRDGDWAEIRVEDTGTGIAENIRSHVFDLFFTTKDVGQGTGQGLPIAHTLVVEKHGGTIDFETETGRGTSFIVRLPIDGRPHSETADAVETRDEELVLQA